MSETFDPLSEINSDFRTQVMKRRISNIINSYRNATDVLAEPIQNALDEIVRSHKNGINNAGSIQVRINVNQDTIEIRDDGRGFDLNDLKKYIAPSQTDKVDLFSDGEVRGHKGVGLTFLAYGFNYFEVESKTIEGDHYRVELTEGLDWAMSDNQEEPPEAITEDIGGDGGKLDTRGTRIKIKADGQSQPSSLIHAFNNPELTAMILERCTAIGVMPSKEEDHPEFEAELYYTDSSGETTRKRLNTSYRFIHEELPENMETLDLGEYRDEQHRQGEIEPRTRDKNRYHCVYEKLDPEDLKSEEKGFIGDDLGELLDNREKIENYIDDHNVTVHVAFSYSTSYTDRIEDHWNIPGNKKYHSPGIKIASDGMISSDRQKVTLSRFGGNKERLWLVYHFDNVEPDLGRKQFPQEVYDIIEITQEDISFDIIKQGRTFLKPTPRRRGKNGDDFDQEPILKAEERKEEPLDVQSFEDYGEITFKSEPKTEQDTVAVFNQLVGMGLLDFMEPVYFSETYQYDSFFEYSGPPRGSMIQETLPGTENVNKGRGVAEFKYEASSILDDIVNNQKNWADMQFLVCWKVDGNRQLPDDEIYFEEVESATDRMYTGVTHMANVDSAGEQKVFVLELQRVLQNLHESQEQS